MAENYQKTVIRHGGWQKITKKTVIHHGGWQKITKKLPSASADGRK
ncbi:MAG: hypothetical protein ACTTK2_03005 [Hoylesella marshii]